MTYSARTASGYTYDPDPGGTDDHAVVVGINRYPGLTSLGGPENDARAFVAWLRSDIAGPVPPENIRLVVSSAFGVSDDIASAKPLVSDVDEAFRRYADRAIDGETRIGRRLYIFLAGHGFATGQEQEMLLTAEASRRVPGYHIPGRAYANWFADACCFDEVVLFMDSCRGWYGATPVRVVPWNLPERRRDIVVRTAFGFASAPGRPARERRFDDVQEVRGVFSKALLDALTGKCADSRGAITVARVHSYVRDVVTMLIGTRISVDGEMSGRDLVTVDAGSDSRPPQVPRFAYDRIEGDILLGHVGPVSDTWQAHDSAGVSRLVLLGTWPAVDVFGRDGDPIEGRPMAGRGQEFHLRRGIYLVKESSEPYRETRVAVTGTGDLTFRLEDLFSVPR